MAIQTGFLNGGVYTGQLHEPLALVLNYFKFNREVNAFWLSGRLRELKNKGKDQPVIHKSGGDRLQDLSIT